MRETTGLTLGNGSSKISVGQLDFDGIVETARKAHTVGKAQLELLLAGFKETDHRRARGIALNRIRHCFDNYGQVALKLLRDCISRARDKRDPDRYAISAVLQEYKRRGWLKD